MRLKRLENFRVEVYPAEPFLLSSYTQVEQESKMKRVIQDIAQQIKRHCDGIGHVAATWTTITYCSYCDHIESGEPDCCEAAIEEREVKGV